MTIYVYDLTTFEHIGWREVSTNVADETDIQPPQMDDFRIGFYDPVARTWELRLRPSVLDSFKTVVNGERDRRFSALTVIYGANSFDADATAISNIMGYLQAAAAGIPISWPIDWRTADNGSVSLSQSDLVTLAALIMQAKKTIYDKSWYLKDTVIPALSVNDVATFNPADPQYWS